MRQLLIIFLESIRDYEKESHNLIGFDERESKEFVELFLKKNDLWIKLEYQQPKPQQRCYVICENHYQERINEIMTDKIATYSDNGRICPLYDNSL